MRKERGGSAAAQECRYLQQLRFVVVAVPERDKRALFASCVARTLKGQLAFEPKARPEVEATVARLGIDFASAVRGNRDQVWTADLLWSRLRKDRILAIGRETLGETWAQAETKQKKADIAKAMQDAFAHGDGVPAGVTAEGRAAAIAWTPPGFRAFDTGTVDDEGAADDEGTAAPDPQLAAVDTPLGNAPEDDGPDPSGVEAETSQAGDPEASAPADNDTDPVPVEAQQPMNARVHSVVESINAPAVAVRRAAALASAKNSDAAPTPESATEAIDPPAGDAGPADHDAMRITIAGGGHDVSVEPEQVMAPPRGKRPQLSESLRIGQAGPVELLRGTVDLEVLLTNIDGAESILVDPHGGTVRCLGRPDIECVIMVAGGEHAAGKLEQQEIEGRLEVAGELALDDGRADGPQIVGEADADACFLARPGFRIAG